MFCTLRIATWFLVGLGIGIRDWGVSGSVCDLSSFHGVELLATGSVTACCVAVYKKKHRVDMSILWLAWHHSSLAAPFLFFPVLPDLIFSLCAAVLCLVGNTSDRPCAVVGQSLQAGFASCVARQLRR